MASLFRIPISSLKGIGAKRAKLFNKLEVYSIGDLVRFYPRDYEDWTEVTKVSDIFEQDTYNIKATIGSNVTESFVRSGRRLSKVIVYDETGAMELVFFNNKYISSMLKYGEEYYFYGKGKKDIRGIQMTSPTFIHASEEIGLQPIYPLTAGLPNRIIQNAVKDALKMLPKEIKDPIPLEFREKYNVSTLDFAIHNIHFPMKKDDMEMAKKRLIFEELLILNLGLRQLKNIHREETTIKTNNDYTKEFEKTLPFQLTKAQEKVILECMEDIKRNKSPMNRLVQGDVGSGKTVVAASLAYTIIKNGYQAAFMAPTEILARQHFDTFEKLFKNLNVNIEVLTGSNTNKEKKEIRERLKSGEIDLIIGTHALITEDTQFKALGLTITDEQHRFGVSQRGELVSKGNNPHLLVMSATPIPRTLGLIIFGDLDISIIDELPPGRQIVDTFHISSKKRHRAFNFIKKHIKAGNQSYIVCPLVEEGDNDLDLASAEEYAENLMENEFANYSVGLLHGKMKASEKDKVMNEFVSGKISLLVATTVIEVGIDVPNATIMMVENAERFGLSQLHQLRGRVGRGKDKSYCILLSDATGDEAIKRLNAMQLTNDGFKIAETDLKLRGPGDFFGQRQHGLPELKIAEFTDMENLRLAQNAAEEIITISKDLKDKEFRPLRAEIKRLFGKTDAKEHN